MISMQSISIITLGVVFHSGILRQFYGNFFFTPYASAAGVWTMLLKLN